MRLDGRPKPQITSVHKDGDTYRIRFDCERDSEFWMEFDFSVAELEGLTQVTKIKEQNTPQRPDYVNDDHLLFLDELRESGVTNMFGAVPYLLEEFSDLDDKTAKNILLFWMKTFGQSNR